MGSSGKMGDVHVRVEDVVKLVLARNQEREDIVEDNDDINVEKGRSVVKSNLSTATVNGDQSQTEASNVLQRSSPYENPVPLDETCEKTNFTTSAYSTDDQAERYKKLQDPPPGSKAYNGSVCSGQQICVDRNQSLIIIGSVNSGGEVLSDGDVCVFGKSKGRALAGLACGEGTAECGRDGNARTFATSFDPKLVCIGDTFTTVDSVVDFGLEKPGEAAMVSLDTDGELLFERVPHGNRGICSKQNFQGSYSHLMH